MSEDQDQMAGRARAVTLARFGDVDHSGWATLQALTTLARAESGRWWRADEAAAQATYTPHTVVRRLHAAQRVGLVASNAASGRYPPVLVWQLTDAGRQFVAERSGEVPAVLPAQAKVVRQRLLALELAAARAAQAGVPALQAHEAVRAAYARMGAQTPPAAG